MEGSGPTVFPLALLPTDSQAPVLKGTLVASPCHDSPRPGTIREAGWPRISVDKCYRGQGRRLLRWPRKSVKLRPACHLEVPTRHFRNRPPRGKALDTLGSGSWGSGEE